MTPEEKEAAEKAAKEQQLNQANPTELLQVINALTEINNTCLAVIKKQDARDEQILSALKELTESAKEQKTNHADYVKHMNDKEQHLQKQIDDSRALLDTQIHNLNVFMGKANETKDQSIQDIARQIAHSKEMGKLVSKAEADKASSEGQNHSYINHVAGKIAGNKGFSQ